MRKNEKVVFGVSVILTIMSILAYNAENILFLILFSGAASVGYWMACGNTNGAVDDFLNKVFEKVSEKKKEGKEEN